MESIWITEMTFKPTGPLTFRRMPSGSLPIMSYPFMPPTTMSGFLQRLLIIAEGAQGEEGGEWPGYGEDWFGTGAKGKEKPPGKEFTLTLGKEFRTLGAYPQPNQWKIHKTRRHGPKNFQHAQFSQILREDHKENYQLHHWDYLFCDNLKGWVAARESRDLDRLRCLKNFGGKAGKEGYLYVAAIDPPRELFLQDGDFRPAGLAPAFFSPSSGTYYSLYGHHWSDEYLWKNGQKGGVDGFFQVGAWWNVSRLRGAYWALEAGFGFPAVVPDLFLKGDVEPFYHEGQP